MDSLTQIVLGAACGEAVLGKKVGNKALLFGAIGGTIPDLDVFVGPMLFANEIDAMLFHRGFMHSILFAILGAFLFGWLAHIGYEKLKGNTLINSVFSFFGKFLISRFLFKALFKYQNEDITTRKEWILLFFCALFTHPILDCFTPYGTQLFAPFSNYRVAFNNIAVADPLYTLPFLICMIVLMFYKRKSIGRKTWLKWSIGISSAYMLFTIGNKLYIDSTFKRSLKDQGIDYSRFSVQPSILNNVLWYGIAETEDSYRVGFYSLLDTDNKFSEWQELPKTRDLSSEEFTDLKRLTWFSNDYYSVAKTNDGDYLYKDLRYPLVKTKNGYEALFGLLLYKTNNRLDMKPFEPKIDDFNDALSSLWERLKGI